MSELLTIFDTPETDTANFQRRLGFWYYHQINPASVMKSGIETVALNATTARVRYMAVTIPEGQSQWEPLIPPGITCDHGGVPHRVVEERHIDVPISQIVLSPHETGILPTASVKRLFREGGPIVGPDHTMGGGPA